MDIESLTRVAGRITPSTRVTVLTGAGISQESGVPTFRGEDGLWRNFRAEELATPQAFERNPVLVWEWYNWRRGLIKPLQPNAGHCALAELERKVEAFTLITQNVDGLHRLAGSKDPIELHGTIWRVRCVACGEASENRDVPVQIPPKCGTCGGLLRPDVVWFGEALDETVLQEVFRHLHTTEVMLIIGTSAVVQPAASFGLVAKRAGAFVAEINRSQTPQSSLFDMTIQGNAGQILPELVTRAAL